MSGLEIFGLVFGITLMLVFLVGFPIYLVNYSFTKAPQKTHWKITDKEILRLIDEQPDKVMSAKRLASLTGLSKSEASGRLSALGFFKVIKGMTTNRLKTIYTLKEDIDPTEVPALSTEPFITKNDLLKLFKHYNYRLTMHKLIWATNLPAGIIMKELKRFMKEKVIYSATQNMHKTIYFLNEPYLSNPVIENEDDFTIDLDLSKLYEKEIRKYKS